MCVRREILMFGYLFYTQLVLVGTLFTHWLKVIELYFSLRLSNFIHSPSTFRYFVLVIADKFKIHRFNSMETAHKTEKYMNCAKLVEKTCLFGSVID